MEPVYSIDPTSYTWIFILLVISGLFFVFLALSPASDTGEEEIATVCFGIVFLSSGITLLVLTFISSPQTNSMTESRINLIQDTYGVPISNKAYEDLGYPERAPEEGTFSSYGTAHITTKENGEIEQTAVTLVWNETEFQLVNISNGPTEVKELPRLEERK